MKFDDVTGCLYPETLSPCDIQSTQSKIESEFEYRKNLSFLWVSMGNLQC